VRFIVNNDLKKHPMLARMVGVFALMMTLFIVLYGYLESHQLGLTPEAIRVTLLGNEAMFLDPMGLVQLVEIAHTKLFLFLLLGFLDVAILFALLKQKAWAFRVGLVALIALLFDLFALFGTSMVYEGLSVVKWIASYGLLALLGGLNLYIAFRVWR